MLAASIGYFVMTCGASAYYPYVALLLAEKGFEPSAVGGILGASPLGLLILLPPVSYVADRYRCGSQIWALCASLASLGLFLAALSSSLNIVGFGVILVLVATTPNYAFFDEYTLALLGPKRRNEWGRARMWGSAGYGVGAFAASWTVDWFGWVAVPVQYTICSAIAVGIMLKNPAVREHTETHFKEVVSFTMSHPRLRLFLFCCCVAGVGFALVTAFLFIYLSNDLDAPKGLFGICIALTVIIELPVFWFAPKLHHHISDRQMFLCSQIAWIVRACGYAAIQTPNQVLPFETLHGITYGFTSLAGTHFVTKVYPESLLNSALGMFHSCFFGIGTFIGNVGGGLLYDHLGPRLMFVIWSAITAVMCGWYYTTDKGLEAVEPLAVDHLDSSASDHDDDGEKAASARLQCKGVQESPRHSESECALPAGEA